MPQESADSRRPAPAPGAKPPTAQVTIAALSDTVRSAGDLCVFTSSDSQPDLRSESGWEIRTADNTRRIARIPIPKPVIGGSDYPFSPQAFNRIGAVPDGDYVIAFTIGRRRCSNVIRFQIDSKFDPKSTPLLQLAQIQPSGMRQLPRLILRAARPTKDDPAWIPSNVADATLSFDGDEQTPAGFEWEGPDEPVQVKDSILFFLDLARYRDETLRPGSKPLQFGQQYRVIALVAIGNQGALRQSNTITLSYKHPLADAWDKANSSIK
ncbi:MAG TPA: hypothetical protein VHY37_13875 [Tepidisphaeraceae bacterium]|nr:hypothetical protein [Tepidisphaeraceae bacterium]